jgi:DNA repair exonuclease SbcCD ATPase subunit
VIDEALLRRLADAGQRLQYDRQALEARLRALQGEVHNANDQADILERAADLIRSYGDEQSERIRADIERLVTYGLQSVFADDGLRFTVTTRVLRGQSAIEFALNDRPVVSAHGGGVAAVVGFILRVVVTLLSGRRRFLYLDEPFAAVSAHYRPALAQFIRELADRADLQLLIVTHDEDIPTIADRHYQFRLQGTTTKVGRLV